MSETATAPAAPAPAVAEPVVPEQAAAPAAQDAEPQEPWYAKLKPSDDDVKIYQKYKDQDAALKSIPHAERRARTAVPFPASDLKAEDAIKAHKGILTKLGAKEDVSGYRSIADATKDKLAPQMKERLGDDWFEDCCAEAAEIGMLPWQFEMALARALNREEANLTSQENAEIARQDKLEKTLKVRYGLQWGQHAQNAELVSKHMDDFLVENAKGLDVGEDGKPVKDAFSRRLKAYNDPVLYAAFDHLFDILLSEGTGGPRQIGGKANDAYTTKYNEAKARYPNRGEGYWSRYANDAVRAMGGVV